MTEWLSAAGFERIRYTPLPVEPEANGPGLFVVAATRASTALTGDGQ